MSDHTQTPPSGTDGQNNHPTTATEVTFFEDRAQVIRTTKATITQGEQTLYLSGLSLMVDDPSLVVRITEHDEDAQPRVLSSKIHRVMRVRSTTPDDELSQLEQEHEQASETLQTLYSTLARIDSRIKRTQTLEDTLLHRLQHVPSGDGISEESWEGAWSALDTQRAQLDAQRAQTLEEIDEQQYIANTTQARLEQGRVIKRDIEAVAHVQLRAQHAQTITVEIQYIVPCALWRPSHVAQLNRQEDQPTITWTSFATVWQATGELWENVKCRFSTARPTQAADPPLVVDDVLRTRPKTEREKRIIDVEARDQIISVTKAGDGTRAVDLMPGVDDGGEPLTLEAIGEVSIASTGEPFQIQLDSYTLPAIVETVAYPERQVVAHLKANATWSAQTPLLAGPVVLMRQSEIVGKAKSPFVAVGEAFDIGFGVESGLRIQREVTTKNTQKKLSRKRHLTRKVRLYISNTSDLPHDITIIERVPVSEIEAIEVDVLDDGGGTIDEHGIIRRTLHIKPNQHQKLNLKYQLELAHNVNLTLP